MTVNTKNLKPIYKARADAPPDYDAQLIVKLIEDNEQLQDAIRALLKVVSVNGFCPWCNAELWQKADHFPYCPRQAAEMLVKE